MTSPPREIVVTCPECGVKYDLGTLCVRRDGDGGGNRSVRVGLGGVMWTGKAHLGDNIRVEEVLIPILQSEAPGGEVCVAAA